MTSYKINAALQILPFAGGPPDYALVDRAIEIIQQSGIKHEVCAFETVMEGYYDEIMEIVKKTQEACFEAGADSMLVYIKIQRNKHQDVTIEDKTGKYRD